LQAAYQAKYLGSSLAITSSTAGATPNDFVLGYADNTTAHTVTIGFTLTGDATMDGTTNFNDLLVIAQHFGFTTGKNGTAVNWSNGDVNYDNNINFNDLLIVAQHFGQKLASFEAVELPTGFVGQYNLALAELSANGELAGTGGGASPVPEPGTMSLLAVGAAGLLARRRRRQA
jgi:hypothetical protein